MYDVAYVLSDLNREGYGAALEPRASGRVPQRVRAGDGVGHRRARMPVLRGALRDAVGGVLDECGGVVRGRAERRSPLGQDGLVGAGGVGAGGGVVGVLRVGRTIPARNTLVGATLGATLVVARTATCRMPSVRAVCSRHSDFPKSGRSMRVLWSLRFALSLTKRSLGAESALKLPAYWALDLRPPSSAWPRPQLFVADELHGHVSP